MSGQCEEVPVDDRAQIGGTEDPDWMPTVVQEHVSRTVAHETSQAEQAKEFDACLLLDGMRPRYAETVRYSIKTMPEVLRHPENWGAFKLTVLSDKKGEDGEESDQERCMRFRAGFEDYGKNLNLKQAAEIAKTSPPEFLRVWRRCLWEDQFGQRWGLAATSKNSHAGRYERSETEASASRPSGEAGSFRYLMEAHPEILEKVVEAIIPSKRKRKLARATRDQVHQAFRRACLAAGLGEDQYPLAAASGATRSIDRLIKVYLDQNCDAMEFWFGVGAAQHLDVGKSGEYFELAQHPYGHCMTDAHRIDVVGTIVIETPNGPKAVPISRLWLVVVACNRPSSDAIVGFSWSYEAKPSAETVERAFLSAKTRWTPRPLCAELKYSEGAGLPNGVIDGLDGAPFATIVFDNDSANWAGAITNNLRLSTGCHIVFGPVGKWFTNARLERIFRELNQAGIHVLPSTVGSGPQDKHRPKNPGKAAVETASDTTFIHDLLEVLLTAANVQISSQLSGMSSLEIIRNRMTLGTHRWLPRPAAPYSAFAPRLGWVEKWCRISGDKKRGIRPYFELYGEKWTSPSIESRWDLIGTSFLRCVRRTDSHVEAYFKNGREISDLHIRGKIAEVPIALSLKASLYNTTKNTAKTRPVDYERVVQARIDELTARAAADAVKRPYKISKAASELAQICVLRPTGVPTAIGDPSSGVEQRCSDERMPEAIPSTSTRQPPRVPSLTVIPSRPISHFAAINKRGRR